MADKKQELFDKTSELFIAQNIDSFAYKESYKTLATNLTYLSNSGVDNAKVFMVTSSIPHEGKTNLVVNLSIALAQKGYKVVLVDCDLRRGTLSNLLHLPRQDAGLTTLLTQSIAPAEVQKALKMWRGVGIDILPSGYTTVNGGELLGSENMRQLLLFLREKYDFVVCDTAPIQSVSDSLELGKFVDGTVLAVAQGVATKSTVQNTKEQLDKLNIPIAGAVLTLYDPKKAGSKEQESYSYYSDYGYGYGEDNK